jgi:hypothetical protein
MMKVRGRRTEDGGQRTEKRKSGKAKKREIKKAR